MSRLPPSKPKHDNYPRILVGTGSCGQAAGAEDVFVAVKQFVRDGAHDIHLIRTGCMGMCHEEPILEVHVPGRAPLVYGGVQPDQVAALLRPHFFSSEEIAPDRALGQRPADHESTSHENIAALQALPYLAGQQHQLMRRCGRIDPHSLVDYEASGGYEAIRHALTLTPEQVRERVRAAAISGRGGGGVLTANKWALAASQPDTTRYMIANGDEGDPGAFSDRTLMESDPHAVIEGLMIAAYAVGAEQAYIYTRGAYATALHRLDIAIAFCRKRGYLGEGIFDSDFNLDIQIRKGSGAYICGEETALISTLEGHGPMPTDKPPLPAVRGYLGHPTVVNNVETLAVISHLLSPNLPEDVTPGTTKLLSLSGAVARPGVVEVPFGTTLRQVIFDLGGGVEEGRGFKGVLVGGPDGGFLPESLLDTPISFEGLIKVGSMLGSGALVVVDDRTCMVGMAHYFEQFEADASCGKCTPCRVGTVRLVERLERIQKGEASEDELDTLTRLCTVVSEGSMCGLGRSAPNPVTSALKHFRDDFTAHLAGHCPTGSCDLEDQS